jgi:hypothetical protein
MKAQTPEKEEHICSHPEIFSASGEGGLTKPCKYSWLVVQAVFGLNREDKGEESA